MIPVIRGGTSFRGAGRYYLNDKRPDPDDDLTIRIGTNPRPQTQDRVAWIETRNCVNDDPQAALDEMWRVHADAAALKKAAGIRAGGRAPTKPVKTIALSWHADEQPDRAAMRAAADDYLAAMGWQEHQAVIVCHTDTKHPHVHIILNRVHPVTGRTLDDSNDRPRAQAWALAYELAHGRVFCVGRELKAAELQRRIEETRNQRNRDLVRPVTALAQTLARRHGHATDARINSKELSAEQRRAAEHLLNGPDLVSVTGYAGTGKTRLLDRARRAWEAEGYIVRGTTLSGIAARNLEQGSGISARTIASLEFAWSKQRDLLDARHILVIDEAGMVSAPQMQRLLDVASAANAKVVLVGDPEQLQPINSPAPYRAIVETIGGVELTEIHRQREDWQRQATRELATQQTRRALARYDGEGFVKADRTQAKARQSLIEQWDQDRRAYPKADRIILAHRRADVAKLNELARDRMREDGALGPDHVIATTSGDQMLAVGDRIVFGRNDSKLGVNNGTRAIVENLTTHRLTASVHEDGKRRTVSIPLSEYNAISHAYAMTVHKTQGVTVDAAHVLATRQFDRHIAYVALSRHRSDLHLHYSESDFRTLDRLSETFARAPLPTLTRAQVQPADIFCKERLKRDYAADQVTAQGIDTTVQRTKRRGQGAGHAPADHKAVTASEQRFIDAEADLQTDAARTTRQERDAMAERHKAERDSFFEDRGRFIKALRNEVYIRARESQTENWQEHHAFAKEARSKANSYAGHYELLARTAAGEGDLIRATAHLAERDAHLAAPEPFIRRNAKHQIEHQRDMIKVRQNEACAAFINERYSDYAALKARQQDERVELKTLQADRDAGGIVDNRRISHLTRAYAPSPLDESAQAAHINDILDRLDLIRETVPGVRAMSSDYDPLREDEERALYAAKAEKEAAAKLDTYRALTSRADHIERGQGGEADRQAEERLKSYANEWSEAATAARKSAQEKATKKTAAPNNDTDVVEQSQADDAKQQARAEAEAKAEQERKREAERMESEAKAEQKRRNEAEQTARFFAETARTFTPVKDRLSEAIGKHYDPYRPYESLSRAAGYELELFQQERKEISNRIDQERDPEMRRILILEDRAAVADYQAHLANRNARLSEAITGRFADPNAYIERMTAHERFYQGMRGQLAGEIGNVDAERADRVADRQREIARELRTEALERRTEWERERLGASRTAESQRPRTQDAETQSSTQSTSQAVPAWLASTAEKMDRKREQERSFHTASREATGTQESEAAKTRTRERERREGHRHGQSRGR